jgi:glycosyltransferase involved in cell wall biosynthesis
MHVVLNSRIDDMVARVCVDDLAVELRLLGADVVIGDWSDYGPYDVAVLRGADATTAAEIAKARARNPRIKIFISDPKLSRAEYIAAARAADCLMVSSVEQREAFLPLNRNILIHYMFPRLPRSDRKHAARERTVVGYHGNKVHIETMAGTVDRAMEAVGRSHPLEFHAVYNAATLGEARAGLPDPAIVPTRHLQWRWDTYTADIPNMDVGIVPNLLPIANRAQSLEATAVEGLNANYEPFDFLIRFKSSCNPGRLYPFAMAGIPVVTDFTPSAATFIRHGESGFLTAGPHGWYEALEALIGDPALRARMAAAARAPFERELENRAARFLDAARQRAPTKPLDFGVEERLATELARYRPPPQANLLTRFVRRFLG